LIPGAADCGWQGRLHRLEKACTSTLDNNRVEHLHERAVVTDRPFFSARLRRDPCVRLSG